MSSRVKESGRPEISTRRRSMANSVEPSGVASWKSSRSWITPLPARRMPRAIAASSSSPAVMVGVSAPSGVRWNSEREVVKPSAPACEPLLDQRGHRRHVGGRRGLAVDAAAAHDEDAQGRMRHLGREVDVAAALRQGVEIVGEALPVPRHALAHHQLGDVFDAFHDLDQRVAVLRPAGREADAAIAHHHGGDAVARGRHEALVPGRLPVIVGVDVDEARRDGQPLGVDLLAPGAGDAADGSDAAVLHGDIGLARRTARAVEHGAVAHHQIELSGHGPLLQQRTP